MKKDPKIFLQHILESISEIEKYTKDISEDEFARSTQVQDAVIRRLEIIGEAAKKAGRRIARVIGCNQKPSYGNSATNGQKIRDSKTTIPNLPILSRFRIMIDEIIMNSSGGIVT